MKHLIRLYPKTDAGRKKFVQDALKPDCNPWYKFFCTLLIIIGAGGMIAVLVWTLLNDTCSLKQFTGACLIAALSMIIGLVGANLCVQIEKGGRND